jgi:hypothetical protein
MANKNIYPASHYSYSESCATSNKKINYMFLNNFKLFHGVQSRRELSLRNESSRKIRRKLVVGLLIE